MILARKDLELRSSRYGIQKEDDAVLKNFVIFYLFKKLYLPIWDRYHRYLFMRGSQDLLQVGLVGSLRFLPNWYNLLRKVGPKTVCFSFKKKKSEDFIRVFGILVISHPLQLRFWPVNYHFERKNIPYETIQNST